MMNINSSNNQPEYEKAINYALTRLHNELPPYLCYHNAGHTASDVLPAARQLAQLDGLSHTDARLLEVAAAYHDIGHIRRTLGHEAISIVIMTDVLPAYGFSTAQIDRLAAMILATRSPQMPHNELECLLVDADMDSLGRPDFLDTSKALWQEQNNLGVASSWAQWLQLQLCFLRGHHYFTATARALRDECKQQNIQLLERLAVDESRTAAFVGS